MALPNKADSGKTPARFLNPEELMSAGNLKLRAKFIVEGLIAGLHKSPYHGFSTEFLEHRQYRQGDSARSIDWRAFARTDKPVVRLFEDETNLYARLFVDKSASMAFKAAGRMTKFDYARTLAASLAWLLIRQRDAVGITIFDESIETVLPPKSTGTQLKNIIGVLENSSPSHSTCCGAALDAAAGGISKRGLCIIMSDLLDSPESITKGLRHLCFKKQDVIVIHILDTSEEKFDYRNPLLIRDMESGSSIEIDGKTAAEFQNAGMASHKKLIAGVCRELNIDCEAVNTDEPFNHAILRILEKRGKLF